MRAPRFWWRGPGSGRRASDAFSPSLSPFLLAPLAALYGWEARRRLRRAAPRGPLPVLCVGNPTVGGVGKTPLALALARAAIGMGRKPGFLSRGYGGRGGGLVARGDRASEVGDEPLLLAEAAPVWVGADRAGGAEGLARIGCDLLIMDDGFQSRRLRPDLALLLVDGARGLGNGRVLPAGPLRAPFDAQLALADGLVVVETGRGRDGADGAVAGARARGVEVLTARIAPENGGDFQGRPVVAASGLGDPDRFVAMLEACGARVVARRDFPDHHPFTDQDVAALRALAAAHGAPVVTTAKDAVRLDGRLPHEVLRITATLEDDAAARLVAATLARHGGP